MSSAQKSVKMAFSIDELAKSSRTENLEHNASAASYRDSNTSISIFVSVSNDIQHSNKRKRCDDAYDLNNEIFNSSVDTTDFISSNDSGNTDQPRKKSRTTFTNSQITELEKYYSTHKYLLVEDRPVIAKRLRLNQSQIKWWFQNRRMKEKRQMKRNNYCDALDKSQFVSVGKSGQRLYSETQPYQVPGYFSHQQYPPSVPMFQPFICSPVLPTMYQGYTQQFYNGLSPKPAQYNRV